jgi:gamma-glutamyltranspeptidase/glutathione hydrolase
MFAGADPVEAVRAPRWIVGGLSVGQSEETVHVEADVPPAVVAAVAAVHMPLETLPVHSESTGHAQLIARDEHGVFAVASDERADGAGRLVS